MLRPSYAELMDIMSENSKEDVTSRYTVVIAAAKRARQLIDGDETMADCSVNSNKPVSIAVEEIREGKVTVVPEGEGTKLRPRKSAFKDFESEEESEKKAKPENTDVEDINENIEEEVFESAEENMEYEAEEEDFENFDEAEEDIQE